MFYSEMSGRGELRPLFNLKKENNTTNEVDTLTGLSIIFPHNIWTRRTMLQLIYWVLKKIFY